MAAALTLCHSFDTANNKHNLFYSAKKPTTRTNKSSVSYQRLSTRPSDETGEEERENAGRREEENRRRRLADLFAEAEKLGKGLKESLSPKQKGDWKDLVLMSFSFAVYVYISQKIVCAYCVWKSMLNF